MAVYNLSKVYCDVVFCEELQVKNFIRRNRVKTDERGQVIPNGQSAKSGLNKLLTDAAFGQFMQVLEWVGFKLGKQLSKSTQLELLSTVMLVWIRC